MVEDVYFGQLDNVFHWVQGHQSIYNGTSATRFASLDPNATSYGGLGNLMFTLIGVLGIGLSSNRIPVFNHAVIQAMFQFPKTKYDSTFQFYPSDLIWRLPLERSSNIIQKLLPCKNIGKFPLARFGSRIYVHGCFAAHLNHPQAKAVLSKIFQIQLNDQKYFDVVASGLLHWMFSNPTQYFGNLVADYKSTINGLCGSENPPEYRNTNSVSDAVIPIDLVVQVRSFLDIGGNDFTVSQSCYENCIMNATNSILQRRKNFSASTTIFISSDNSNVSFHLYNLLRMNFPSACVVTNYEAKRVYSSSLSGLATDLNLSHTNDNYQWHSGELLEKFRLTFDSRILQTRFDLLDWMIISSATSAVYTEGSSFVTSARMRRGFAGQLKDVAVHTGGGCLCKTFASKYS